MSSYEHIKHNKVHILMKIKKKRESYHPCWRGLFSDVTAFESSMFLYVNHDASHATSIN